MVSELCGIFILITCDQSIFPLDQTFVIGVNPLHYCWIHHQITVTGDCLNSSPPTVHTAAGLSYLHTAGCFLHTAAAAGCFLHTAFFTLLLLQVVSCTLLSSHCCCCRLFSAHCWLFSAHCCFCAHGKI